MAGIADTTAGANQGAYVMSAGVIIQRELIGCVSQHMWRT